MKASPKVSVYIVSRDYGRYLGRAIESVLKQTFTDWELIVIDDGSTDETDEVLRAYASNPHLRIVRQGPKGFVPSCNHAVAMAQGEYIIRLDGDDYFDENALLVLGGILDRHPDVGLVYPDYYLVSPQGEILELVRRKKIHEDDRLMDLPAHGAGTMIRRRCLLEVGGYDETVDCQDGYGLWLKIVGRYPVYNVNLPLFYYRKHPASLTTNQQRILKARRALKARHIEERLGGARPSVLAVVPVRNTSPIGEGWALRPLGGRPVLQHTLDGVKSCPAITRAVVVTEDETIAAFAQGQGVEALLRPPTLARLNSPIEPTIIWTLERLEAHGFAPEIVCLLHANAPFRRAEHIAEAIDTLVIYQPDSVISVCENTRLQYRHREEGLEPLFQRRELRLEREALYEENGAIYVSWRRVVTAQAFLGKRIGHILMTPESGLQLDSPYECWLAEQLVEKRIHPILQGLDL